MTHRPRTDWSRAILRHLLCAALFLAGVWLIPHRWCARHGDDWYAGRSELVLPLARGVETWVRSDLSRGHFQTGSAQFNGEWLFGTYMMAAMGFGQTPLEHPATRARHAELMGLCLDRILSPQVRAFDTETWGDDPIGSLDGDSDHAAFLGYFNLALSLHRFVDPNSKHAALNDRITAALARRLEKSRLLMLCSYPGEVYPVDNCAVIGSIGLYDRATGADHGALLRRWAERCRSRCMDARTGLLYQCVNSDSGSPADAPRGSGSALGAYFLSFTDPALSRDLYRAIQKELSGTLLGFGVVREYPRSIRGGRPDIDSGPIILGCGVSATGFTIGGSRIHRDGAHFARLYSTAHLFGAPLQREDKLDFVMGGPLGNAILFAMVTAQPDLGAAQRSQP